MKAQNFEIVSTKSIIDWVGRKVTGAHNGTIDIKQGTLSFSDDTLTGGNFIIDTTSIKILDVTDLATNEQFAGHLASDDFFNSKQHPKALFVIRSAKPTGGKGYRIEGELTIKGITHPVGFDAQIEHADGTVTASGKVVVDRTKYEMKFRSGNFFKDLGDTLIYNDFDLNVKITAKAAEGII